MLRSCCPASTRPVQLKFTRFNPSVIPHARLSFLLSLHMCTRVRNKLRGCFALMASNPVRNGNRALRANINATIWILNELRLDDAALPRRFSTAPRNCRRGHTREKEKEERKREGKRERETIVHPIFRVFAYPRYFARLTFIFCQQDQLRRGVRRNRRRSSSEVVDRKTFTLRQTRCRNWLQKCDKVAGTRAVSVPREKR